MNNLPTNRTTKVEIAAKASTFNPH